MNMQQPGISDQSRQKKSNLVATLRIYGQAKYRFRVYWCKRRRKRVAAYQSLDDDVRKLLASPEEYVAIFEHLADEFGAQRLLKVDIDGQLQ